MLRFFIVHEIIWKGLIQMELNLKNDIVFKAFFAKKGNEKYLKSFLESLLNEKIDEIEVMRRSKSFTNEKNR